MGSETTHASGRHFPAQDPALGDVLGMGDQRRQKGQGGTWAEESRAAMHCSGIEYVPRFSVTRLRLFVTWEHVGNHWQGWWPTVCTLVLKRL